MCVWVHMHVPVFSVEVKGIFRCFQCSALQVYFDLCVCGVCPCVWVSMAWCWESCWIALHHIYWGAWAQSSLTQLVWPLDQQDFRWDTTSTQGYMGAGELNLLLTLKGQELYLLNHFHSPTLYPPFEIGCFCELGTDYRLAAQQALGTSLILPVLLTPPPPAVGSDQCLTLSGF